MWELRDHRYGGRAKRYAGYPRGVVRCLDPAAKKAVAFSTELQFENWLLFWGDPAVSEIDCNPPAIQSLENGKVLRIKPHLVVRWREDGKQPEAQLVISNSTRLDENRLNQARRIAAANLLGFSVRSKEEIRTNPILLENLRYLRQCATMHADEPSQEIAHEILQLASRQRDLTRGEVILRFSARPLVKSQIDAVLIRMQWQHLISIGLAEQPIGERTLLSFKESFRHDQRNEKDT